MLWTYLGKTQRGKYGFHGKCGSETLLLDIRYQEVMGTAKTPTRRVSSRQGWPDHKGDNPLQFNEKCKRVRFAWLLRAPQHGG